MNTITKTVGVIVGRFQVPRLRKGHRKIIEFVRGLNEETVVLLGVSEFPTSHNPLGYELRKAMISAAYPDVHIQPVYDHPSNEAWIEKLDAMIATTYPSQQVTLYGSRDSFLSIYTGRYATEYMPEVPRESGTAQRKKVAMSEGTYEGFRRGIIHTYERLVPTVHATVDIAVLRHSILTPGQQQVLLGRKRQEDGKWRFIGGRVDPADLSAEYAARRELREEAGNIETSDFRYLGSQKINDWRYRGSKDGVLTSFYCATYVFGYLQARDDIHELKWFNVDEIKDFIIEDHQPLVQILLKSTNAN
jgi:bifunctional NMN adenylyltransferase/nudix hydrolase